MSIFSDWEFTQPPEILPSGGEISRGKSINVSILSKTGEIRYTLNGKEPTRKSPLFEKAIKISDPAVIKAKVFKGDLAESSMTSAEFKSALRYSAVETHGNLKQGLKYKYFKKQLWYFNESIILDSFNPEKEGFVENFELSLSKRDDGFIVQFDGYIEIPEKGQYIFYLFSNGVSRLFIDNHLFVHKPRINQTRERSYTAYLEKGKHSIGVLYTNPWAVGKFLKVSYEGPGIKKQEIPSSVLYYK